MSSKSKSSLRHNLKVKGIIIPIIFALVVVIFCVAFVNQNNGFFPNGNHNDALTTTAPTQTTEFDENEFSRVIQN